MATSSYLQRLFCPERVMDPRQLGAMQPYRLSASRSLLATMMRDKWRIQLDSLNLNVRGNGTARYTISAPGGTLTFLAWLFEPRGGNRTGRIIGTSWDMLGTLIDGIASDEQVAQSAAELPKLYEGRAPSGTLIWMRSNQSLRLFAHVREQLAAGLQPDATRVQQVGYLMRNTGLDGNGTFGSLPFPALSEGHPLRTSYHAQMLSAYLMRELSVDLVEELARLDAPSRAVRLAPHIRKHLGVGNGSALGLVMFAYNRPVLLNAYINSYTNAVTHTLKLPIAASDDRLNTLESLLEQTIQYRRFDRTRYRMFTGARAIATDLTRIQATLRAARRGDMQPRATETLLTAVHRSICPKLSPEAVHSFNALLVELAPDYADALAARTLHFTESLEFDPRTPNRRVLHALQQSFRWALTLSLNDADHRDRVWYQARAAEEPRSGPAEEVPGAHEVIPDYPSRIRELQQLLSTRDPAAPIGWLLAERPELEQVTRAVLTLTHLPYAIPHADPHDIDFVPVWLIRLINGFIHGLDRTEDHLNREVLGLIYDGAPFRDELHQADPAPWWWRHRSVLSVTAATAATPEAAQTATAETATPATPRPQTLPSPVKLSPRETPIVSPHPPGTSRHTEQQLTIRFRELRLIAGRALQALNMPAGLWHSAREFVALAGAAEPLGIHGFGQLLARSINDRGEAPPWRAPRIIATPDALDIDAHGASLHLIGAVLVNAFGATATETPTRIHIRRLQLDHAAAGLELALARSGVTLHPLSHPLHDAHEHATSTARTAPISIPTGERSDTTLSVIVQRPADDAAVKARYQAAVRQLLVHGIDIAETDWWNVFYPSNAALYPDTRLSRQHTGSVHDVYEPGQQLTRLFHPEELLTLTDPNTDTDLFIGSYRRAVNAAIPE